jgi:hypothetical protein
MQDSLLPAVGSLGPAIFALPPGAAQPNNSDQGAVIVTKNAA